MPSRFDPPCDDERDAYAIPRAHCETPGCPGYPTFPTFEVFCTSCLRRHAELLDRLRLKAERQRQEIR